MNDKPDVPPVLWLAVGIALGGGFGITVLDRPVLGLGIGLAFGALIMVLQTITQSKDGDSDNAS